jgi:pyridoxal phosphate enzyme (YggS family)
VTSPEGSEARRAQLEANLASVEERISSACRGAGRLREAVTLVVVTKTWPAGDAALLRDLGVTDLGENRDQEAAPKAAAVPDVRWHFVGQLQTNKARSVASYAHVVHAVDRDPLVDALSAGAQRAGRELDALLQVSLDGDTRRGGAAPEQVPALAELVVQAPALRLRGLMAVAPLGQEPGAAFARLAAVAERLRADHPDATEISAGMSGDLEEAIAAGATLVRVGSAVLGDRPTVLG